METTEIPKEPIGDGGNARLAKCNVRKALALLRQKWDNHGPASPMCLDERINDELTIAEFCVLFLLAQRSRRNGVAIGSNEVQ